MTKKLVIHIGTMKTGTTSIQKTLGTSSKILREYGLWYPSSQPYNHNINFCPIFTDYILGNMLLVKKSCTKEQKEKEVKSYLEFWKSEFERFNGHTFIISSEILSHFNFDEVKQVQHFISQYFDEVKIIAYVRPFESLIPSMTQELVKLGLLNFSSDDFSNYHYTQDSKTLYTNCIQNWIRVFGENSLVVRPFDRKAFKNGDLISDFLDTIGFGDIDTKKLQNINTNESLGQHSVTFLAALNQKYPLLLQNQLNKSRGLASDSFPLRNISMKIENEKFQLDLKFNKSEAELLNKDIAFINQYLPKQYQFKNVESSEDTMVFPNVKDIPVNFYIELLNEYHKEVENYMKGNEFYEQLFDLIGKNKEIFIWGAGSAGIKTKEQIEKINLPVSGFIDSDIRKSGTVVADSTVYTPQEVVSKFNKSNVFIIVSSTYYAEITKELLAMGFEEKENFIVKYIL